MTSSGCHHYRSTTGNIRHINISVVLQEQLHAFYMVIESSSMDGSPPFAVLSIDGTFSHPFQEQVSTAVMIIDTIRERGREELKHRGKKLKGIHGAVKGSEVATSHNITAFLK